LAFVRELEADGFGNQVAMHVDSALPRVRSLELQVPGGRTSVSVTDRPHFTFDNLVGLIQRQIDEQLWQLYRNPEDEPNRAAFWRAERRWLQANPDPVARAQRFVTRLVKGWPQWGGEERARGVAFLLSHPDRKQVLAEQHGELALASLRARGGALEPVDQQLLEIAASAPGDRVWRACVEFAVA
ncbi:MAG: hypothetical protein KDC48_24320, partial [Planctomycetes bacterium]|nr:hypothetical protein [Planctomycetota bacterium]